MKRLIFFVGVYDTLDIFTYELKREFEKLGYETMLFDSREMEQGLKQLAKFVQKPVQAAITFNNLGFNMELKKGENIWEQLKIPCINILMDHPFCYKNALENAPANAIVLCTDRNHMRYVQRFYPDIPVTGFLPHAGKELEGQKKRLKDRKTDVMYAGNLSRAFVANITPDFAQYTEFDAKKLCEAAYQELIFHPHRTTEEVLEELLRQEGITEEERVNRFISELHFVDLYAVSYYREKTVRCIAESGIPITIYGAGWEICDWIHLPNVSYEGKIPAEAVVEKMQDAKVVLSTMTWFKDGTHDRVFNGMLAGALTVSDSSLYMKEEMTGNEMVLFELEELDSLADRVKELLGNLEEAQKIADCGYEKAKKEHTWKKRAYEIEQDILNPLCGGAEQKKILVITHQLSRTGAPIVLLDMIRTYREAGYGIDVISMQDGELRQETEKMGISVQIKDNFWGQREQFLKEAGDYDLVVANTLITYEAIHVLAGTQIPVIWWIHEGAQYFSYFKTVLPDFAKLPPNIHVFSVGHYVQNVVQELYHVTTEILHFGLEDVPRKKKRSISDKVRFLTAGTYSAVKGQDILAQAIALLPAEIMEQAEFAFYGSEQLYDEAVFESVERAVRTYPNVHRHSQIPHEQMLAVMEEADCLVVPSRIDPIPTVAAEMMMKENACLCTTVCGISYYIKDGENGYLAEPDNPQKLAEKLIQIVKEKEKLPAVGKNGRRIYEEYFSKKVFEPKVKKIAEECMRRKQRIFSVCMIVKNEEKVLERSLLAAAKLGAELVVADTGSMDKSRKIINRYTEQVWDYDWQDDFAAAKNFVVSKAHQDYILVIDADEYLEEMTEMQIQELEAQIQKNPAKIGRVLRKNVFEKEKRQPSKEWIGRVFSRKYWQYQGKIHEQLVPKGKTPYETYCTNLSFVHSGYDLTEEERAEKTARNIRILEKELEASSIAKEREAEVPYLLFQLGKSYYMARDYERACEFFAKGLSYDLNPKLEYVIDMVQTYGYALLNCGRTEEALGFESIAQEFGNDADFWFLMGHIYMKNAKFEEAVSAFLRASEFEDCCVEGVNSYLAFYNIGVIYECRQQLEKAKFYYEKCGRYEPAAKRRNELCK